MSRLLVGGVLGVLPGAIVGYAVGLWLASLKDGGFEVIGMMEAGTLIGAIAGFATGAWIARRVARRSR